MSYASDFDKLLSEGILGMERELQDSPQDFHAVNLSWNLPTLREEFGQDIDLDDPKQLESWQKEILAGLKRLSKGKGIIVNRWDGPQRGVYRRFQIDCVSDLRKNPATTLVWSGEDDYEEYSDPWSVAHAAGINILSHMDFLAGFVDEGKTVAALFTSADDECYSFDIAVDEGYRKQGLASKLMDIAIDHYDDLIDVYPDMKFCLKAVNPIAERMLKSRGFVETSRMGDSVFLTRNPTMNIRERVELLHPEASDEWDDLEENPAGDMVLYGHNFDDDNVIDAEFEDDLAELSPQQQANIMDALMERFGVEPEIHVADIQTQIATVKQEAKKRKRRGREWFKTSAQKLGVTKKIQGRKIWLDGEEWEIKYLFPKSPKYKVGLKRYGDSTIHRVTLRRVKAALTRAGYRWKPFRYELEY